MSSFKALFFYFLGLLAGYIIWGVQPAPAHEAMSGWKYDWQCCSDRDCHEAADNEVVAVKGGFFVPSTMEYIPYTDKRVKVSGDGGTHRCTVGGKIDGQTLCIYVGGGT